MALKKSKMEALGLLITKWGGVFLNFPKVKFFERVAYVNRVKDIKNLIFRAECFHLGKKVKAMSICHALVQVGLQEVVSQAAGQQLIQL